MDFGASFPDNCNRLTATYTGVDFFKISHPSRSSCPSWLEIKEFYHEDHEGQRILKVIGPQIRYHQKIQNT